MFEDIALSTGAPISSLLPWVFLSFDALQFLDSQYGTHRAASVRSASYWAWDAQEAYEVANRSTSVERGRGSVPFSLSSPEQKCTITRNHECQALGVGGGLA